jgi:hypothetical protein
MSLEELNLLAQKSEQTEKNLNKLMDHIDSDSGKNFKIYLFYKKKINRY